MERRDRTTSHSLRPFPPPTGPTGEHLESRGTWHTRNLQPGQHARLQIQASAGEQVKLWCNIPGHAEQGMRTTLTVAR
jgi:uncharacterized cupredoxin-like copper-binding protein